MSSKTAQELWEYGFNQENERCLRELPALKQAAGIPLGPVANDELPDWIGNLLAAESTRKLRIETLLLHASLLRVQGRFAESARWTDLIAKSAESFGVAGFFVYFESGIKYFARGDSHSALEFFVQASRMAPTPFFELNAQLNTLLCLENLALPCSDVLTRVKELSNLLGNKAAGALAQIKAYELRMDFRSGKFEAFTSRSQSTTMDQAEYFRLWVRQLPYHSAHSPLADGDIQKFSDNRNYFFQNSFRLRTLRETSHPSDWETLKPSEFVQRFYLWVWKWLADPTAISVKKVVAVVVNTKLFAKHEFLDQESQAILRNALLWLSLFDPASSERIANIVDDLQRPNARSFPLLALEADLIDAVRALRDGDEESFSDMRAAVEGSFLWNERALYFKDLLSQVLTNAGITRLPQLSKNLSAIIRTKRARQEAPIVVDIAHSRILDTRSGEQIISEPMAIALDVLERDRSVPVHTLLAECFGIQNYDPLIHQTKLGNLMQRLKRLSGHSLRFRTKSGFALAEGDWSGIEIIRPTETARKLINNSEWQTVARGKLSGSREVEVPALKPLRREGWKGSLTRAEIESRIQRPRSSTNRILANWEKSGKIHRVGAGRAVRYVWREV